MTVNSNQCSVCQKYFKTNKILREHLELVHSRLYTFFCAICGQGVRRPSELRDHMANRHNAVKEFQCPHCGKEYGYKKNMVVHLRKCQE